MGHMPARTQAIFIAAWLTTATLGVGYFLLRLFTGF
jgi:hypothetical protein